MPQLTLGRTTLLIGVLLMSAGSSARADDCDDCEPSRWNRFKCWCKGDDCDDGYGRCRHCRGRGCRSCRGPYSCHGSTCWSPIDAYYCDPRDRELYSAQGYNVPVAVPLAPVVKHTYNYGWGVPSSRLVRVGARYDQWYPTTPFTQTGGRLPGGIYPTVYQPTDTTQMGAYHVHVPRWGRYGTW